MGAKAGLISLLAAMASVRSLAACEGGSCAEESDPMALMQLRMGKSTRGDNEPRDLLQCPHKAVELTQCMDIFMYDKIVQQVEDLLEGLPSECNITFCPRADITGCWLRMAGHDLMDGKADGCTDMTDPDNAGLTECLVSGEHGVSIQDIYSHWCQWVSVADFIYVAAEAVMKITRKWALAANQAPSGLDFDFRRQFRFGRKTPRDCDNNPALPNPERGCDAVEDTFLKILGLNWYEAAALMGVHTLGRAQVKNSGYDGWWSTPQQSKFFNNNYFIMMAISGWFPQLAVAGNPNRNQWRRDDRASDEDAAHQMMLNTDLCLLYTNSRNYSDIGVPVKHTDNCCAWVVSRATLGAIKANGGIYCGSNSSHKPAEADGEHPILDGGREEHEFCCHRGGEDEEEELLQRGSRKARKGKTEPEDPEDCGNFFNPESVASDSVLQFANDEATWVKAFLHVWKKVSTIGHPKALLHGLKLDCGSLGYLKKKKELEYEKKEAKHDLHKKKKELEAEKEEAKHDLLKKKKELELEKEKAKHDLLKKKTELEFEKEKAKHDQLKEKKL